MGGGRRICPYKKSNFFFNFTMNKSTCKNKDWFVPFLSQLRLGWPHIPVVHLAEIFERCRLLEQLACLKEQCKLWTEIQPLLSHSSFWKKKTKTQPKLNVAGIIHLFSCYEDDSMFIVSRKQLKHNVVNFLPSVTMKTQLWPYIDSRFVNYLSIFSWKNIWPITFRVGKLFIETRRTLKYVL